MSKSVLKGGLLVLELPLSTRGSATHPLYIKDHVSAGGSSGKTSILFVGNVDYCPDMPPREIDGYLRELFAPLGEVVSVSVSALQDADGESEQASSSNVTSRPSRFAHVQFTKSSAVRAILQACRNDWFAEPARAVCARWGMDRHVRQKTPQEIREQCPFVDVDRTALKQHVDSFMAGFEEDEAAARRQREKRSREPDDDGFMPVQHRKKRKRQDGGRKGGSAAGSALGRSRGAKKRPDPSSSSSSTPFSAASASSTDDAYAPNATKTLQNFYGFQQKEQKQTALLRLREQFEEDRLKVARLKAQRKFKPF